MKNEFKGTKGKWSSAGGDNHSVDIVLPDETTISVSRYHRYSDGYGCDRGTMEANAELIAEAGNVRQQINFTLTELLEKYNELKASRNRELEKAVMYGYNTFEHGLSQRQLEKRAEAYPLSQIVEP